MVNMESEVAEKYAQALFELAVEDDTLQLTLDELTDVIEAVKESNELTQMLHHPRLTNRQKKEVIDEIFADKVSKKILNFLKLLLNKKREDYLEAIHQQFKKLVDQKKDRLEVEVQSPIELSATHKEKLINKLKSITAKEINLKLEIKPELLGGLVLKIGDKVIDGSMLNHLQGMKQDLHNLEVSKLGVK